MGNTAGIVTASTISGARLDHVAFGVDSMRGAAEVLEGTLGGSPHEGGPGPGYTGAQWRFANGARLEVLEPAGSDGFLHRFLRARGPRIHHVTFIVPELEQAARSAGALGYEVVGYNDAYPSWKECFLHPKQALGIVVQMAQKSDEPDGANTWGRDFAFPPAKRAASMAGVDALRLSARSRDAAVKQWGTLLGGRIVETSPGVIAFSWPDSPIRLVVEVDHSEPEGPTLIEVTSEQEMSLSSEAYPALGTRFFRVQGRI